MGRSRSDRRRILASVAILAAGCLEVGEIDDDPAAMDQPIDDGDWPDDAENRFARSNRRSS